MIELKTLFIKLMKTVEGMKHHLFVSLEAIYSMFSI
jgi:hypothetical protein